MSVDSTNLQFLEIEHKFLVELSFDLSFFCAKVRELGPELDYQTSVSDTYFLVKLLPRHVFRHRCDNFIQQLTVKSLAGDNETRVEVNLELGLHKGNQGDAVRAFLEPLGVEWSGTLLKNVQVFYFRDVEIVYYEAIYENRVQKCIEIEARAPSSVNEAKQVLSHWESLLGLDAKQRSRLSILELLVLPTLSTDLRTKFRTA